MFWHRLLKVRPFTGVQLRMLFLALFVAIALSGGATIGAAQGRTGEQVAFESAKELGTPAAFNAFLTNYPSGFYADLARAYLKKLNTNAAGGEPAPSSPPSEPAVKFRGVNGSNVVMVRHGAGAFVKTGRETWTEQNSTGTGTFKFKEVGRRESEVQLFDGSRSVFLGIDVAEAIIWYSDSTQPRRPLYEIIEAQAGSVAPEQMHEPAEVQSGSPAPQPNKNANRNGATGCEEGQRFVDGRCRKIRTYEKPQGCPKGTEPVPETDNCRPIKKQVVRCKSGYSKVDGKCIKFNEVVGYCGPGYRLKGEKCVPRTNQAPSKPEPAPSKGQSRPQWQIDAINKGCKPGQAWNKQEGCHEDD